MAYCANPDCDRYVGMESMYGDYKVGFFCFGCTQKGVLKKALLMLKSKQHEPFLQGETSRKERKAVHYV